MLERAGATVSKIINVKNIYSATVKIAQASVDDRSQVKSSNNTNSIMNPDESEEEIPRIYGNSLRRN